MIARYNGKFYNVRYLTDCVRIWCFQPQPGFSQKITRGGNLLYDKHVAPSDIEQVFEVGFSVNWDGEWCGVFYSAQKDLLSVGTNNRKFAETHGMDEFERGTYDCAVPASKFNEFRMRVRDYHTKEVTYTMVSSEEFKQLWKEMVADLIPPRN